MERLTIRLRLRLRRDKFDDFRMEELEEEDVRRYWGRRRKKISEWGEEALRGQKRSKLDLQDSPISAARRMTKGS